MGKDYKLGQIKQYAYYGEDDDETMLIWYLDLQLGRVKVKKVRTK